MPALGVEALLELLELLPRDGEQPVRVLLAAEPELVAAVALGQLRLRARLDPDAARSSGDSTASRCHTLGAMADRGSFALGKIIDPATGKPGTDDLVVGSSDLTTHGVIVGMTGSGKTGLAIVLLEEALLAGIPALIIDPKGDMGNLALTFPDLAPASFQPWVNASDAQAAGITVEQLAEKTATTWREGLAAQGIGPEQIQKLKDAADVTIYTPGSSAGVPLNVVGSLRAPALSWDTEAETLRDEIEGTVTSLLGLVGITADPLSSREHVLLSNLIENAWRAGPRPRPRHADRRDPDAPAPQARRVRDRRVLPAQGPHRARAEAERADRVARVRRLGRGRGRSIRRRCSSRPRASRARRSSTPPTSRTRSGCSSPRSSSRSSSPGCAASPAPPTCARSRTWTRSPATCRRPRRRRPRSRS